MSDEEAERLSALGQRLASISSWWGDDERPVDATVIRCRRGAVPAWEVTFVDCVGIVSIGTVAIEVHPKIPMPHFLYLLAAAGVVPRSADSPTPVAAGQDLWALFATWCVQATEAVMRHGLVCDYVARREDLRAIRGRINAASTAEAYYKGRLSIDCEYDEFGPDMPLNRVLRAASERILSSAVLPSVLRERARRIAVRMDDVGPLEPTDLRAAVDRRAAHYADAVSLARHVLAGTHRTISHGGAAGWSFLVRTPEMVERGVRRVLEHALGGEFRIRKSGFPIEGAPMMLIPDLTFEPAAAVADVKYKRSYGDWPRTDLYQIVAFAEAAGAPIASVIGFADADHDLPPRVRVGSHWLSYLAWMADPRVAPALAARLLEQDVSAWLHGHA